MYYISMGEKNGIVAFRKDNLFIFNFGQRFINRRDFKSCLPYHHSWDTWALKGHARNNEDFTMDLVPIHLASD